MAKKPKNKKKPKAKKTPHTPNQNDEKFVGNLWSFSVGDQDGKWPLNQIRHDHFDLFKKLRNFEALNEAQLNEQGSHMIPLERLCKDAKDRLTHIKREDLDGLFSFRVKGERRLWAIRHKLSLQEDRQSIYMLFQLLWWDPKHQVCPSVKKNT